MKPLTIRLMLATACVLVGCSSPQPNQPSTALDAAGQAPPSVVAGAGAQAQAGGNPMADNWAAFQKSTTPPWAPPNVNVSVNVPPGGGGGVVVVPYPTPTPSYTPTPTPTPTATPSDTPSPGDTPTPTPTPTETPSYPPSETPTPTPTPTDTPTPTPTPTYTPTPTPTYTPTPYPDCTVDDVYKTLVSVVESKLNSSDKLCKKKVGKGHLKGKALKELLEYAKQALRDGPCHLPSDIDYGHLKKMLKQIADHDDPNAQLDYDDD